MGPVWPAVLLTMICVPVVAQQQNHKIQAGQAPVTVERSPRSNQADLAVPLCPAEFNDSLNTDGIAFENEKGVKLPIVKKNAAARFSPEGRRAGQKEHIPEFETDLSLLVGSDGNPQNVCIRKSAGYGLDAEAAKAAMKYRFKPATKDGRPVSCRLSLQVRFRLFKFL